MRYFLLLLALVSTPAFARKIVYNLNGVQYLVEVGPTGSVFSDAEVVWDEKDQGPLPSDAPVLYAVRCDDGTKPVLCEDAALKSAKLARDAAAAQAETDKVTAKNTLKTLKAKIKAKNATAADVRDALGAIMDALKIGD